MPGEVNGRELAGTGVKTLTLPHVPGTVERSCETCDAVEYSAGGLGLRSLIERATDCYVATHRVVVRTLA